MKQKYIFKYSDEEITNIEHPPFEITGSTIEYHGYDLITVVGLQELMPFLLKIHELVDKVNELEERVKKCVK